jgi:hypothetical protein
VRQRNPDGGPSRNPAALRMALWPDLEGSVVFSDFGFGGKGRQRKVPSFSRDKDTFFLREAVADAVAHSLFANVRPDGQAGVVQQRLPFQYLLYPSWPKVPSLAARKAPKSFEVCRVYRKSGLPCRLSAT